MFLYHIKFQLQPQSQVIARESESESPEFNTSELDKIGVTSSNVYKHFINLKALLKTFYIVKVRYASLEHAKLVQRLIRKNFHSHCKYKYFRLNQLNEAQLFEFNFTFWIGHCNPRPDQVMNLSEIDENKVFDFIHDTTLLCNMEAVSLGDTQLQTVISKQQEKNTEVAIKLKELLGDGRYDKNQFLNILCECKRLTDGNLRLSYNYLKHANMFLSIIGYQVESSQRVRKKVLKRVYQLTQITQAISGGCGHNHMSFSEAPNDLV